MPNDRDPRKSRLSVGALLLLVVCATVIAAGPLAADDGPQVSGDVRVNAPQQLFPNDNPTRSTTTITASADGQDLLVGFEDLQGACGPPLHLACPAPNPPGFVGFSFSTDGGRSWTDGGAPPPITLPAPINGTITHGHPDAQRLASPHHGDDDHADHGEDRDTYLMSTVIEGAIAPRILGLAVYRGHFGAGTFTFDDSQTILPANVFDLYTREALVAAKDGSPDAYLALVNIDEICDVPFAGFGQIELFSTHDGGASWTGPVVVSPETATILDPNDPNCGNAGFLQIAPAIAMGPHGEVYVVWQYGPEFFLDGTNGNTDAIAFSRSVDGGHTFSPPTQIVGMNAMRANPPVGLGQNRMNDQPRIAVATGGPHRGRIYVTIFPAVSPVGVAPTVQSVVSSQAYILYSDDRGTTWSAPQALAPPIPPTGVKRVWPTVSVRPNGDVDVTYLESREVATGTPCNVEIGTVLHRTGPASSLVDTYWVQSRDGGSSFGPPVRVSSGTSNWCTAPYHFLTALLANFGFYIGSTSVDDRTLMVWPDDSTGGPVDVYFASVKGQEKDDHHDDHDDSHGHGHGH
jgi:hypothetical protein